MVLVCCSLSLQDIIISIFNRATSNPSPLSISLLGPGHVPSVTAPLHTLFPLLMLSSSLYDSSRGRNTRYGPSWVAVRVSNSSNSSTFPLPFGRLSSRVPMLPSFPPAGSKSKYHSVLAMTRLVSKYAMALPTQERVPVEKGIKASADLFLSAG